MEKTWRYVCTMTTHPSENTRRPCRQVKLSLAAGSVLIILLPLTIGLNASKHRSQNPKRDEEDVKESTHERDATILTVVLLRTLFLLLPLCALLDQLLAVLQPYRDPAILIQILVHEIVGSVVVIRHTRGLDFSPHGGERSVFVHGRADHQHQYRATDAPENASLGVPSESSVRFKYVLKRQIETRFEATNQGSSRFVKITLNGDYYTHM